MEKLLFEIGTEEIPAKFMPVFLNNYKSLLQIKCRSCVFRLKISRFMARLAG